MATKEIYESIVSSYVYLVKHIVAGPLSLSWAAPGFLLPIALMIPPELLSHTQLMIFFLGPIVASSLHTWVAMGGVDVVSVDLLCWCIFLLAANDPRVDFKRVRYIQPPEVQDEKPQNLSPCMPKESLPGSGSQKFIEKKNNAVPNSKPEIMEPSLDHPAYAVWDDEDYPADFLLRLRWVINLIASDRLVRWKIGYPRHDSQQKLTHPTRLEYTVSLLPVIIVALLTICVTSLLANHDPYFRNATTILITSPYPTTQIKKPSTVQLLQYCLPPYVLRPLALGFYTWALLTFEFNLLPIIPVYLNYLTGSRFPSDNWSPHTLPPYFGPFVAVLDGGLKRAWGTWWHQHMRFMVTAPGLTLIKMSGVSRKSQMAYTMLQSSAFLFSGIVHMGLVPPEPVFAKGGSSAMMLRLRIASFFWFQAVGCIIESVFEKAVQRVLTDKDCFSPRIWTLLRRTVIAAWIIFWLCLTLRLPTVPFAELRYWDLVALPVFPAPVRAFLAGEWLP